MSRLVAVFALVVVPLLSVHCESLSTSKETAAARTPEPKLFTDLGRFERPVTTRSNEAQRYFDQGLLFCFCFNHEEAIRSFRQAAALDPGCAMAWWGAALAAGPHINNPTMDEAASRNATEAVKRAQEKAAGTSAVERDLIDALSKRYVWPPPADRKALDQAYADAMREVWKRHPKDADVGALFAESMLDLRPWDQWTPEGKPQPGTEEITAALARVLEIVPDHPGALHYTIHAWEASPTPEKALPAADRLRNRVPGAGHVVHMPSHIDFRVGHYFDAIVANEKAVRADLAYVEYAGRVNFNAMYRAHDYHFLAWAAMYDGQSRKAIAASRELVREMPREMVDAMPDYFEAFLATPYHVLVRFGRWDEILREPAPDPMLATSTAFFHYARTMAFSAKGQLEDAVRERATFEKAAAAVPASRTMGNNAVSLLMAVARPLADGELEYRRGNYDKAFELLNQAVKADDALRYDEPWGWMQPARHALGALLLEQGRVADAEAVYREDLKLHPDNGWSLHGLAECLTRRGDSLQAAATRAKFVVAWSRADCEINASCFCRTQGP